MTTLPDRTNTALLVIDVQNGVVGGAHDREPASSQGSDRLWNGRATRTLP